ncbi:MAG UNVERIFIED_CONTAM: hypothetical protein LVR18_50765 [Planctomycetaceae bacterium]
MLQLPSQPISTHVRGQRQSPGRCRGLADRGRRRDHGRRHRPASLSSVSFEDKYCSTSSRLLVLKVHVNVRCLVRAPD